MKSIPNLTFLRYFYCAAESKSISKASKDNFVSQSAISQAIAKLETAFGKQLITHEQNRFQITQDGALLLEKCKDIFKILSEIEDSFNEVDGIYKGKLTFACTHSFALSLLPPFLTKLSRNHSEVEPVLRFGHPGTIIELVKRGEVDFGIVLDNEDFSQFQSTEIHRGKHQLYRSKHCPEQLFNKFIISEERKEVLLLKKHFDEMKLPMDSIMEVSSWEVIAILTEQGLGTGFFPDYLVGKRALIPVDLPIPEIPYKILAIYSKHQTLGRNARMFIELMSS